MKKLVLLLAVLLVSLPAMAAVTIDAECDGGVYTVTYTTTGNLPRAFALDIEVDAGVITDVGSLSADYDIYPGSIVIENGEISDLGSAVCDDAYPDTLGGIGTAGVTIEMGSLYADGEPAPATSGILFTFTVSDPDAVVTISENGIRGGVVMENPDEDPALTINVGTCDTTPPLCYGDISGPQGVPDGLVTTSDMSALLILLSQHAHTGYVVNPVPAGWEVMDISGPQGVPDGILSTSDMSALLIYLSGYAGTGYVGPCMPGIN